jgi:DNA invertase Pin-like site-specific DNA recombinase
MGRTKKHQRVAIYTRVSKASQTTDNQLQEIQSIAERQGWTVVEVYTDHGISGAKGREKRPSFDRLYKDASRRKFDLVMAWSIDRIGRSVHAVSGFIAEMEALGIGQYYYQQAIDTTTPSGKAMIQMCVVFAEFERGMITERIHAGLKRAKDDGKTLGRPRVPAELEQRVRAELSKGAGIIKVAKAVGVGNGTVQRIKGEMAAPSAQRG